MSLFVSGMRMKYIVIPTIFFASFNCWAFDHDVVKGQWALYQETPKNNDLFSYGDIYYFLDINTDFSGTLIRYFGRGEPTVRSFKPSSVIKRDGYIEIDLNNNEKAILSAWKHKTSSGKLNGLIFLYDKEGELFNMLHFPLELIVPDHKLLNNITIKNFYKKYR